MFPGDVSDGYAVGEIGTVIERILTTLRKCNGLFHDMEPWRLAKQATTGATQPHAVTHDLSGPADTALLTPRCSHPMQDQAAGERRDAIVFLTYEALRVAATLLYPVTPLLSVSALKTLGSWPATASDDNAVWRSGHGLALLSENATAPDTPLQPCKALVQKVEVGDLAAVVAS